MDPKDAKDYAVVLWKKLLAPKAVIDRLIWIPMVGIASFLAFDSIASLVLGLIIGWGICAILTRFDDLKIELYRVEFDRHVHQNSDETKDARKIAEIQLGVEKASRRWWSS